jgi:hypothetical protein
LLQGSVYASALLLGAAALGSVVHLAARPAGYLPDAVAAVVVLWCAATMLGLVPDVLPNSRWRIPRTWGWFGRRAYTAIFGGILGFSALTALPSVSLYALVAWGATERSWRDVLAVFVVYGLSRAAPVLTALSRPAYAGDMVVVDGIALAARVFWPVEVALLVGLGALLLLG